MANASKLTIFTDGGSRGNPGPAAVGVSALNQDQQVLFEASQTIGRATNNVAEYRAFLQSLLWLTDYLKTASPLPQHITWQLDSKLVVEQLNKRWRLKDENLALIARQIWQLLTILTVSYEIKYVPREQNKRADWLVNQALDR